MSNAAIVDGKQIAADLLQQVKLAVAALSASQPVALGIVLIGEDEASRRYVEKKTVAAREVGIDCRLYPFPKTVTSAELIEHIHTVEQSGELSGIIVQYPLPDALWPDSLAITEQVPLSLDVDCLSPVALGRLLMGKHTLVPPIVGAIVEVLRRYDIELAGKRVCVVGRGELIGKPLTAYLLNQPVTLTVCGRSTADLAVETAGADIIISGVGQPGLIRGDMIKPGATVIDMATVYTDGKVRGDVDFESVQSVAGLLTPVPGGIGPITVAKLLENTVIAAKRRN